MSPVRKVVFSLYFLSGFCSLLYQVIWVRLAFAHFGNITPVLSIVIAVFMLGMSLGSWLGGRWIARSANRGFSAIYAYAVAEGFIGLSAFLVPMLFSLGIKRLLPGGELSSVSYLIFSALILAISILPWSLLMGTTFPFMMAYMRERETVHEASFSFLYLANVSGAMFGTILTVGVLVELLGFRQTLAIAGVTNFLIAGISLVLGAAYPYAAAVRREFLIGKDSTAVPLKANQVRAVAPLYSRKLVHTILFITGLTSMSLGVIWVRDFTPVLGTTVYAFALIAAVYLLANWMGSGLYRRQAVQGSAWSLPTLIAALAVTSLWPIVINDPRLHLRNVGVILGIFPFSFILGYLTPDLIDLDAAGDPDQAGRAYAIHLVGRILGPLLASYFFLPYLGAKGSMILMALPFGALLISKTNQLPRQLKVPAGCMTAVLFACALFVNRSYEEQYDQGIIRRDSTATVISLGEGRGRRLLVNGAGMTELTTISKVMAHIPLAILPQPKNALMICFGMGTTYRSLLTWPGLKVTAIERVPSVLEAFGYYHADAEKVMANPAGRVVIDDGRRFLSRTGEQFDLVTIDPPSIAAAGSSLLYSREFYEVMKKKLRQGAILQQWFPGSPGMECEAIARSLTDAFPYVKAYGAIRGSGIHFYASMQPIKVPSAEAVYAKMSPAARKDLAEWEAGADPQQLVQKILAKKISLSSLMPGLTAARISDDRPYNEFYLLRRNWAR